MGRIMDSVLPPPSWPRHRYWLHCCSQNWTDSDGTPSSSAQWPYESSVAVTVPIGASVALGTYAWPANAGRGDPFQHDAKHERGPARRVAVGQHDGEVHRGGTRGGVATRSRACEVAPPGDPMQPQRSLGGREVGGDEESVKRTPRHNPLHSASLWHRTCTQGCARSAAGSLQTPRLARSPTGGTAQRRRHLGEAHQWERSNRCSCGDAMVRWPHSCHAPCSSVRGAPGL